MLRSQGIQIEWDRACEDVFTEFAPAEYDYRFEKTRLHVRLLRSDYVSRSEAKRLLANLERFREVVLDFKAVRSVGQGFADEVFRAFPGRHPHVKIVPENTNPVVAARRERTHRWSQVVPGSDVVLFTVGSSDSPEFYDDARIDAVRPRSARDNCTRVPRAGRGHGRPDL